MPGNVPAAATWELDRWLDDELLPSIDALAAVLRAQPAWERNGFRRVVVFSYPGWAHCTGNEEALEASVPEPTEGTLVMVLTRDLPPPDGRTYFAAIPLSAALVVADGADREWFAQTLLEQAVAAVPAA